MTTTKEYLERVARRQATSIDRMLGRLRREDRRRADGGVFQTTFEDYLKDEDYERGNETPSEGAREAV